MVEIRCGNVLLRGIVSKCKVKMEKEAQLHFGKQVRKKNIKLRNSLLNMFGLAYLKPSNVRMCQAGAD